MNFSTSGSSAPGELVHEALTAFKARDRDTAAARLRRLVETGADLGPQWGAVSRLASTLGEIEVALTAARKNAAALPGDPGAQLAYGQLLAQYGRIEAALELGLNLTAQQPNNPAAWHFLGVCLSQRGKMELSIQALRKALALQREPAEMAPSWQSIAESKSFTPGDNDIEVMRSVLAKLPPDKEAARSVQLYALGKAYDDVGDVSSAFEAYAEGARIMRRRVDYRADDTDAFVSEVIADWTPEFAASLPAATTQSNRPIFVFGLPRSGTTLVEQILASHTDVSDGAELNLFNTAAMPIQGFTPAVIKAFAAKHGSEGFDSIGRSYLDMLEQRFGKEGRIVDKTLNHSRYLGLIRHILPNARFIWLSRSPGGVAWSCFRTRFSRSVDWTWSLEDIGRYFRGEDRLREHWAPLLGDAVLTVPYDELVGDVDTWIDRILKHVGLPHQAGLADFHKTDRLVTTASFAQVRKPLYTTSREGWRRYEAQLEPFFKAYQG